MRKNTFCPSARGRRQVLALAVGALLASPGLVTAAVPIAMSARVALVTGFNTAPRGVDFADFNNDGVLDIISVNAGTAAVAGSVKVRLGQLTPAASLPVGAPPVGNALYGPALTTTIGVVGNFPYHGAAGNLDDRSVGPARLDYVTANFGANNVSVLLGNGAGGFTVGTPVTVGLAPTYVALGDLNRDGHLDLVTSNSGSDSISVAMGTGLGTFGVPFTYPVNTTGSAPYAVAIGDINGDTFLDIVTANRGTTSGIGTVSVFIGDGAGNFALRPTDLVLGTGTLPESVVLGDVNGDTYVDIVTANSGTANIGVFPGRGLGTFTSLSLYPANGTPRSVALGDMNNDSMLDIVFVNWLTGSSAAFGVLPAIVGGGFDTAQNFATTNNPADLTLADVNGDFKPDVITADEGGNQVSLFANTTTLSISFVNGRMHITPPPRTTVIGPTDTWGFTTEYAIHYNTMPRFNVQPWIIWAKWWPGTSRSNLAIDMTAAATANGCRAVGGGVAWCYRTIGSQVQGGQSYYYRVFARRGYLYPPAPGGIDWYPGTGLPASSNPELFLWP